MAYNIAEYDQGYASSQRLWAYGPGVHSQRPIEHPVVPTTLVQSSLHEEMLAAKRRQQLASRPPIRFHPMHVVDPFNVPRMRKPLALVPQRYFSDNYRGERTLRNCSAAIPDSDNCSLWITHLPAGSTHTDLLSQIHNCGRVYATVINPPDVGHATAAAKVVFFTREAAQALYLYAQMVGLCVSGLRAHVGWNRIKTCEQQPGRRSRVLIITGHASFVNAYTLTR
jgi:hypothetical protein